MRAIFGGPRSGACGDGGALKKTFAATERVDAGAKRRNCGTPGWDLEQEVFVRGDTFISLIEGEHGESFAWK
jgi:hypothetical protein